MTNIITRLAAGILAMSVALASILFMGYVFWNEFYSRGVIFYEPNRLIAFSELLLTAFSITTTVMVFFQWVIFLKRLAKPYDPTEDLSE